MVYELTICLKHCLDKVGWEVAGGEDLVDMTKEVSSIISTLHIPPNF